MQASPSAATRDESPTLPEPLPGATPLPRDIAFLLSEGLPFAALYRAGLRADELGTPAHVVLIAQGVIDEEKFVAALRRRLDAVPLEQLSALDPRVTLAEASRQGWCRARSWDGRDVLLVSRTGPVLPALLHTTPGLSRGNVALATAHEFRDLLVRSFRARIALDAASSVDPVHSARSGATRRQRSVTAVVLAACALLGALEPDSLRLAAPLAFGFFFLGASLVMLSACIEGAPLRSRQIETRDAWLPGYSILAPLYREARVLDGLIASLDALDYPREKLQVLLVLEEHDHATRAALAERALPPHFGVVIAPPGTPHTKPRALNAAMPFVTGEYVVVYDAEDRPERDQLRAAAAAFARARGDVACLQARLAIDNTGDSWLTRLFTIEYTALFDVVKAGNARLGLPVPLGGTSNHFRTKALRRVGLWDAWNVTEDADLGIRLALNGLHVDDLPSTTFEEAPNRLAPWLAQRVRWLKGWMQTVITHSRAPVTTCRAMGVVNFLAAISLSAGIVVGALGAPAFYALLALRLWSDEPLGSGGMVELLADSVIVVLGLTGLLATFLPALIGLARRRLFGLAPWLLLVPLYQLLVSLAAWIALVELLRAPHRWNKTMHGLARTSRLSEAEKASQPQKQ